jgi:prepilin-type N-terminal cleavage/methylation domain-containing protein
VGFTLVELLVVIGIIGVLVGMLLPVLSRARAASYRTVCMSNLNQIHLGLEFYAHDNRDYWPDGWTTGSFNWRVRPGTKSPNGMSSHPEVYGLAAILAGIEWTTDLTNGLPKAKYIPADSNVWICPAQQDWMRDLGNTYCFNTGPYLSTPYTPKQRKKMSTVQMVYDNYTFQTPGLSGLRGPWLNYTYNFGDGKKLHVHSATSGRTTTGAICVLYMDGHVAVDIFQ